MNSVYRSSVPSLHVAQLAVSLGPAVWPSIAAAEAMSGWLLGPTSPLKLQRQACNPRVLGSAVDRLGVPSDSVQRWPFPAWSGVWRSSLFLALRTPQPGLYSLLFCLSTSPSWHLGPLPSCDARCCKSDGHPCLVAPELPWSVTSISWHFGQDSQSTGNDHLRSVGWMNHSEPQLGPWLHRDRTPSAFISPSSSEADLGPQQHLTISALTDSKSASRGSTGVGLGQPDHGPGAGEPGP